jgi:ribosome-associated toxin RatA of RatAB toxin-antitoxin module
LARFLNFKAKVYEMSKASTQKLFDAPAEKIFKAIIDFDSYADFIPEVKKSKVLERGDDYAIVELTVNFVKEVTYSIKAEWKENKEVWWSLVEGDVFKKNDGRWELEDIGSQTQVTYSLDVEFKIFVPGMILKKAVAVSLPSMIDNFKKRVASL